MAYFKVFSSYQVWNVGRLLILGFVPSTYGNPRIGGHGCISSDLRHKEDKLLIEYHLISMAYMKVFSPYQVWNVGILFFLLLHARYTIISSKIT